MSEVIKGLTWAHTRGYVPKVAASQAYTDFRPEVEFEWSKVSLRDFGEGNLDELGERFDLLVIDYPFVGTIAEAGLIYPLDELFDEAFVDAQRAACIGPAFGSYSYDGRDWALPLDSASQVTAYRPDLLEASGHALPRDFGEVVELARATGRVAQPLAPLAASGTFWTLCTTAGERPLRSRAEVVSEDVGVRALGLMHDLFAHLDPICMELNPIQLLGLLASSDRFMFAPSLYGYSNYSRVGYAPRRVEFANVTGAEAGVHAATIGGAGLVVSRATRHLDTCLEFARFVSDPVVQGSLYVDAGGQPAHEAVWTDARANELTGGFFANVAETMRNGYVRPNYPGFAVAQSKMAALIRAALTSGEAPRETLAKMNEVYTGSLPPADA